MSTKLGWNECTNTSSKASFENVTEALLQMSCQQLMVIRVYTVVQTPTLCYSSSITIVLNYNQKIYKWRFPQGVTILVQLVSIHSNEALVG